MELPLRFNASLLTLVLLATLVVTNVSADEKVVFCYYHYMARLRPGNAQMSLEFPGPPCSHLVYNYADFDTSSLKLKQGRFTSQELDLLKLLHVTGETKALLGFTNAAEIAKKTSAEIQTFAKQTAIFLRANFFHGLELNTLFQGSVGENKFKELCQALKNAFSKVTGEQETLILSAMFKDIDNKLTESFHTSQSLLDFVVVKSMPEDWNKTDKIVHPSPLYVPNGKYSENRTMMLWKGKGIPAEKLVLMVPTFGWSYKLSDENTHGIGQKAAGHAAAGPLTHDPGFLAYYEICDRIKRGVYSHVNDGNAPTAWGRRGGQLELVAYETRGSIERKAQYIVDNQFRGLAFVTLDFDDFRGTCGQGFFPLTKAGWKKLVNGPWGSGGGGHSTTTTANSSAQLGNSMNGLIMFAVAVGVINNCIF